MDENDVTNDFTLGGQDVGFLHEAATIMTPVATPMMVDQIAEPIIVTSIVVDNNDEDYNDLVGSEENDRKAKQQLQRRPQSWERRFCCIIGAISTLLVVTMIVAVVVASLNDGVGSPDSMIEPQPQGPNEAKELSSNQTLAPPIDSPLLKQRFLDLQLILEPILVVPLLEEGPSNGKADSEIRLNQTTQPTLTTENTAQLHAVEWLALTSFEQFDNETWYTLMSISGQVLDPLREFAAENSTSISVDAVENYETTSIDQLTSSFQQFVEQYALAVFYLSTSTLLEQYEEYLNENPTKSFLEFMEKQDLLHKNDDDSVRRRRDIDGWISSTNWLSLSRHSPCSWYGIHCNSEGFVEEIMFCCDTDEDSVRHSNPNNLLGSIPTELSLLRHLQVLDLFQNQLTNTIPTELGILQKLERLDLGSHHDNFKSKEDAGLATYDFSLDGNKLTGTMPSELGQMSKLTSLSLSENLLTGIIPTELGNLSELRLLFLRQNFLSGFVPTEFGLLASLTSLYLEHNDLKGDLNQLFCMATVVEVFEFVDLSSDCWGLDPEIICDCCLRCCLDGRGCSD